jgi:DNA-directed RNA polymerase subunit M/transcription elongation factor TFIIS
MSHVQKILTKFVKNVNLQEKIIKFLNTITNDEDEQCHILYETISSSNNNVSSFLQLLKQKKFLFQHSIFEKYKIKNDEQEAFLENPPMIEDGIIECHKCHSKKTYSYAKQTRASDEGTSVFVTCSQCHFKFRLS